MRRLVFILVCLAAVATGASLVAGAPPAGAQLPPDDPSRGLIYAGLRRAGPESVCNGAFEILSHGRIPTDRVRCTHGPDPIPAGLDPRPGQDPTFRSGTSSPAGATIAAATAGMVGCYGDGSAGYRVQLMYATEAGTASHYADFEASFRDWAARVDDVVNTSASATGGIRHVRFVTDSQCQPVIQQVTISSAAVTNFSTMIDEFDTAGINRVDRKYLVWVDTTRSSYCGIALIYDDQTANTTPGVNANNGNPQVPGQIGRVDRRCWGQTAPVEAHELAHTIGAVQRGKNNPATAPPHATNNNHCFDEHDRLCYADGDPSGDPVTGPVFKADGTPTQLQYLCPTSYEPLLDCNHDDYFSTSPGLTNWLATHWNSANSAWLATAPADGTPGTTAAGNAWFSDGTRSHTGAAGTSIRVFGTNAAAGVPYQLVTGRNSVAPSQPCGLDLVAVNTAVVQANSSGLIPTIQGTVNRLPGTYQVCFAQVDPITGSRRVVTGVSTFTVQ